MNTIRPELRLWRICVIFLATDIVSPSNSFALSWHSLLQQELPNLQITNSKGFKLQFCLRSSVSFSTTCSHRYMVRPSTLVFDTRSDLLTVMNYIFFS